MVQKFSYNWLAEYLGNGAPSPAIMSELLTKYAFEVEGMETLADDTVIELKILPDRGSDCLCHRGIARELATLTRATLAHDPLAVTVTLGTTDEISVQIEDPVACPRFTASIVRGVTVADSPQWLKARLAAIGVRSINNIVDATNSATGLKRCCKASLIFWQAHLKMKISYIIAYFWCKLYTRKIKFL